MLESATIASLQIGKGALVFQRMTPTEYAFLRVLARHAGRIVTQRQLLREVWGPQGEGQTHYLRVYANHLRKKLGPEIQIRNEPCIGYRLLGPEPEST